MKRRAQAKEATTADRVVQVFGFVLLVGIVLFIIFVPRIPRGPDYCPIDGHAAEWTRHGDTHTCEYGHFSGAEKTIHTWSGACP